MTRVEPVEAGDGDATVWTDMDLTLLVEAVTAEVWAQQKDSPWEEIPAWMQHAAREAVLPFVTATVRHMASFVAAREAQALRAAAESLDEMPSRRGRAVYGFERDYADGQDIGIELAADHLRDRADRIERGESS